MQRATRLTPEISLPRGMAHARGAPPAAGHRPMKCEPRLCGFMFHATLLGISHITEAKDAVVSSLRSSIVRVLVRGYIYCCGAVILMARVFCSGNGNRSRTHSQWQYLTFDTSEPCKSYSTHVSKCLLDSQTKRFRSAAMRISHGAGSCIRTTMTGYD